MDGLRKPNYIAELIQTFQNINQSDWDSASSLLLGGFRNSVNVWIAGNGGNSANASHFATDWNKGLYTELGRALKSHTLWENPSLVSAITNDQAYETVFSDQLRMWATSGDIAVLLTGGGTSRNIIAAAQTAKELGLTVIGLTGGHGLELSELFDIHIHISSGNIQIVEDVHAAFGHAVFKYIISNGI